MSWLCNISSSRKTKEEVCRINSTWERTRKRYSQDRLYLGSIVSIRLATKILFIVTTLTYIGGQYLTRGRCIFTWRERGAFRSLPKGDHYRDTDARYITGARDARSMFKGFRRDANLPRRISPSFSKPIALSQNFRLLQRRRSTFLTCRLSFAD